MKRELNNLADKNFDILIIGGGIYGASLAYLASLDNIKVALIEKNDFASGTSSNSQKIIHGGLRYLSKLDFKRIKESVKERRRLMWLAPHLVYPLPCVVPVYGHGLNGKEGMGIGFKIYNFLSRKRNDIPDNEKYIPDCELFSKEEISSLVPGIDQNNLTAGAKWYDGFCINTERLIISFLKSAFKNGTTLANYVSAEKLLVNNNKVLGVEAVDSLSEEKFNIHAETVVNCSGTWLNYLSRDFFKIEYPVISGINIVTKKIFDHENAVGLRGNQKDSRFYFVVPWKGKSILGTEWYFYNGKPDELTVNEKECQDLINNFNWVYPTAELRTEDISFVHKGLVYGKIDSKHPSETLNEYKIEDLGRYGYDGLLNVLGVKYTTAVDVAEKVLQRVIPSYRKKNILEMPKLIGGNTENFSEFKRIIIDNFGVKVGFEDIVRLINTYGTEAESILNSIDGFSHDSILKSEVLFNINNEMAVSLSDVFLRRTGIGDSAEPSESDVDIVTDVMSKELKWTQEKVKSEKENLISYYPEFVRKKNKETPDKELN